MAAQFDTIPPYVSIYGSLLFHQSVQREGKPSSLAGKERLRLKLNVSVNIEADNKTARSSCTMSLQLWAA
jgi:hypothetical protein